MDKKGILIYLVATFGIAYACEALFLWLGVIVLDQPTIFNNVVLLAIMYIPALGALIASRLAPNPDHGAPRVWPIPPGTATRMALIMPCIFAPIYIISLFLGMRLDWRVGTLMNPINNMMQQPLTGPAAAIAPAVAIIAIILVSIVLGATLFAFVALGGELGWRGYLLPRLMPLGRVPASLLVGLVWGLWFLPLIYGYYREDGNMEAVWSVSVRAVLLTTVFSVILGDIWQRTKHIGLTAVCVGCLLGQFAGIWEYLFQYPQEPWTGRMGIVAIAVWVVVAMVPRVLTGRMRETGDPIAVTES